MPTTVCQAVRKMTEVEAGQRVVNDQGTAMEAFGAELSSVEKDASFGVDSMERIVAESLRTSK